jgi:hypothetical protein
MTIYRHDRSAVARTVGIPFEVSQELPRTMTIYERIDLEWVRARVRENPLVTLRGLSQLIQQQFEVIPSISHMLRIQQLAGISRIQGSRASGITQIRPYMITSKPAIQK